MLKRNQSPLSFGFASDNGMMSAVRRHRQVSKLLVLNPFLSFFPLCRKIFTKRQRRKGRMETGRCKPLIFTKATPSKINASKK